MEAYHHLNYIRPPPVPPQAPPPPHHPPPEPNPYHQSLPPPYQPPNPWFPNHFQYPPPPPQSQFASWPPPPPSFPPYRRSFQEWPIPNWINPQPFDHSVRPPPNSEDWAAKAREWAAGNKIDDPPTYYRPGPSNPAFNLPEVPNSYSSPAGNYPHHGPHIAVRAPNPPVLQHESNNQPPFSNFRGVDRPKKASVPKWLKEEIIKNASTITKSSVVDAREEELENSRSADFDEEDGVEEEDESELARSASVNLQIKRVLTEVLLKVTDELFDEIATKVLDEDEDAKALPKDPPHVVNASPASVPEVTGTVDLLGLASYASDEDDNEENYVSHEKAESKETEKDQKHERNGKLKGDNESDEKRKPKTKHNEEERNRYKKRRSPSDSDESSEHSKRKRRPSPSSIRSRERRSSRSPSYKDSRRRDSSYRSSSARKAISRSPKRH